MRGIDYRDYLLSSGSEVRKAPIKLVWFDGKNLPRTACENEPNSRV